MRSFRGTVHSGFGYATGNFLGIMRLIEERTGLAGLVPGTLNVRILEDYIIKPMAVVDPREYFTGETIKLQRCLVNGHKAIIVRPDWHETRPGWGHGKNHFELMGRVRFRDTLGVNDGEEVEVQVEGDDAWWAAGL